MSKYAGVKTYDIANGKGFGVTVFLSGCDADPKCKGCFNKEAWDKDYGNEIDVEFMRYIKDALDNKNITHISILGGEPFAKWNIDTTIKLCSIAHSLGKKTWVWTWRTIEEINDRLLSVIQDNVDVLVDGRYIEEQRNVSLPWRGSENQRVIDTKKTIDEGRIVLYIE